jgi:hypothetical protein
LRQLTGRRDFRGGRRFRGCGRTSGFGARANLDLLSLLQLLGSADLRLLDLGNRLSRATGVRVRALETAASRALSSLPLLLESLRLALLRLLARSCHLESAGFLVRSMVAAPAAELAQLDSVRVVTPALVCLIVAPLALLAGKRYRNSNVSASHLSTGR